MKLTEKSYFEFADRLTERGAETRSLREAFLELTRICPLRCEHCYIGDARWQRDPGELGSDDWKRTIDALAERGVLFLFFTGGEALARPDFRELWLHARSRGFLLLLYTNATLIDEEMGGFLSQHPPAKIEVSIYGATKETYESVTHAPGSFPRFLRGVEQIRKRGFLWRLKAPLIPKIARELAQLKELAREWNVHLSTDGSIFASIGEGMSGGKAPCAARIPAEELAELQLREPVHREEFLASAKSCAKAAGGSDANKLFSCGAGKDTFYMSASGKMQACVATPSHAVQLRRGEDPGACFDKAWARFGELRSRQRDPSSPCYDCDLERLCGNCPGKAELETGDEHSAIEWICRQTHLKAHALGVPHRCKLSHPVHHHPGRSALAKGGKDATLPE